METLCFWTPHFAVKGQGHTTFLLTLTSVLWMLGGCQLNSDLADNPSGLQAAPAEFSTPPLQTTFAADSILSSKTVTPTPVDSAADLHSSGSSPEKHSDGQDGSIFVSPRVTITPSTTYSENLASSFASDLQFSSSFSRVSETVDSLEVTPVVSENPSLGLVIESTHFLDSVAASLRWNPAEGVSESTLGVRHVQSSIPPDTGAGAPNTGTPAPDEHSSSTPVLVAPTTTWFLSDTLSPSVTEDHASWSGEDHLETFASSASLPVFSPVSEMFNTTQPSTSIQSVAAETTSPIWSSTPGVSSPVPAGGNTSCAEKDTGCVEYRGEEDSREEEVRIKVIVGGACGAILLVVVLGVFIGCMLRRRGKMSSGSKIDLSSYWDDNVTLSYINGHIDIQKDNADEMISLDNDSFLNSLDSMSFTNTWTSDTSKHTNF